MSVRFLASGLSIAVLSAITSGCASEAEMGSVTVEVRLSDSDLPSASRVVTVYGPEGEMVETREVESGTISVIDQVPLGWVTVEADSSCEVASELNVQHPSMTLIFDGDDCILTD